MPNYLEGEIAAGGVTVGVSSQTGSNFDNVGVQASAQSASVSAGPVSLSFGAMGGLMGAQGGGSKPEALHTEYATGESEGPAYGSQDIVFYLQRAGVEDEEGKKESEQSQEQSTGQAAGVGAGGAVGPTPDNGQVPSGANQIAVGSSVGSSLGTPEGGSMAPISGMSVGDEVDVGTFTQNASRYTDVEAAARNAVRYVESLGSEQLKLSLASSERLMSEILARGFSPDEDLSGIRDANTILNTLSRPTQSELAFQLARAVGGRCRAKDIVMAVNNGEIGLVNAKARAFQDRMGSVRGSNR
jgi:hypothetical protein